MRKWTIAGTLAALALVVAAFLVSVPTVAQVPDLSAWDDIGRVQVADTVGSVEFTARYVYDINRQTWVKLRPSGLFYKAKEPFTYRFETWDPPNYNVTDTLDAVHAPADTVDMFGAITAGALEHPVWGLWPVVNLESIDIGAQTTDGDTIWMWTLYKFPE